MGDKKRIRNVGVDNYCTCLVSSELVQLNLTTAKRLWELEHREGLTRLALMFMGWGLVVLEFIACYWHSSTILLSKASSFVEMTRRSWE
jgi:hypothetical protein